MHRLLICLLLALGLNACSAAHAAPSAVVRVGGPSAPGDSKVAIVGSSARIAGTPFTVVDAAGKVVLRGRLAAVAGSPAPWRSAARADLTPVTTPGSYRVRVGTVTSRPWVVRTGASSAPLGVMLRFFAANSDGDERSPDHGPAHLNDGTIRGGPF